VLIRRNLTCFWSLADDRLVDGGLSPAFVVFSPAFVTDSRSSRSDTDARRRFLLTGFFDLGARSGALLEAFGISKDARIALFLAILS